MKYLTLALALLITGLLFGLAVEVHWLVIKFGG